AAPQSAGHGLNLQHGGNTIIWFGPNWSLELWQQMNKRLHRPGQTKPVFIHILSAAGTIDEKVMRVLGQKDATQKSLMQAVLAEI
ncbi:MAG: ATP-dependent helicase, partial [Shewanella sp.]